VRTNELGIQNIHVSNSTFQELQYESTIEVIGAQELGVPKVGQNINQVVSGKGDLTVLQLQKN